MPQNQTETWVVQLFGGPKDGAEVRMDSMFCDIHLPGRVAPMTNCYDLPKQYVHVYKRISPYRAEYTGCFVLKF